MIQNTYTESASLLPNILELKQAILDAGFKLTSYKSDMNNFSFEKGIYAIVIDNDQFEHEVWAFVSKNGLYIYRKQIKSPEDFSDLHNFIKEQGA